MQDPFVTALAALFRAPGTVATVYSPAGGAAVPTRAIRHQPTGDIGTGDTTIPVASNTIMLMRSVVPSPQAGEDVRLGNFVDVPEDAPQFSIAGAPRLDAEGLTWLCELLPA